MLCMITNIRSNVARVRAHEACGHVVVELVLSSLSSFVPKFSKVFESFKVLSYSLNERFEASVILWTSQAHVGANVLKQIQMGKAFGCGWVGSMNGCVFLNILKPWLSTVGKSLLRVTSWTPRCSESAVQVVDKQSAANFLSLLSRV